MVLRQLPRTERVSKLETLLLKLCIRHVTLKTVSAGSWKIRLGRLSSLVTRYSTEVRTLEVVPSPP